MDAPRPATITRNRTPRFRMDTLFSDVFADDGVSQWLLSKEPVPPCAVSPDMVERLVAVSTTVKVQGDPSTQLATVLLKRPSGSKANHGSGANPETHTLLSPSPFSKPSPPSSLPQDNWEKFTIVCHGQNDEKYFISMTDDREPFTFIEPASHPSQSVRRGVIIQTQGAYAIVACHWRSDTRSNISGVFYDFSNEKAYSEKQSVLLGVYPESRYPRYSDVVESVVWLEEFGCPYCLARHEGVVRECECLEAIVQRMKPVVPSRSNRDGWSVCSWAMDKYEPGVKKAHLTLKNHRAKVALEMEILHSAYPIFSCPVSRVQGFGHYLKALEVYWDSKIYSNPALQRALMLSNRTKRVRPYEIEKEKKQGRKMVHKESAEVPMGVVPDPSDEWNSKSTATKTAVYNTNIQGQSNIVPGSNINRRLVYVQLVGSLNQLPITSAAASHSISCFDQQPNPQGSRAGKNSNEEQPYSVIDPSGSGGPSTELAEITLTTEQKQQFERYLDCLESTAWSSTAREACKFCPAKVFRRKHDLKRHVKSFHLATFEFQCSFCGNKYRRKSYLDIHITSVHEKKTDYICALCSNAFATQSRLTRHHRQVHRDPDTKR